MEVSDRDFSASFAEGKWTVRWVWKEDKEPLLDGQCGEYAIKECDRAAYVSELALWVEEGWLVPYDKAKHGEVRGLVPLMAVRQANKQGKVRPVMDYREVNEHVLCYPGQDAAVCDEKLRRWRRLGGDVSLLDLKKAYLQLHVADDLVRFQAVRHHGVTYVLTRLAFGLNVAPKIMSKVLGKVLSQDETVAAGTDHYIDDIIVDETVVSAAHVKQHLQRYGLVAKEAVPLDGARVLGLKVARSNGALTWRRDNVLPDVTAQPCSRRELFSVCGRLVGHYPQAGWLRVACAFMKREAGSIAWNAPISGRVHSMLHECLARVEQSDPVRGRWPAPPGKSGRVWCDASSLALGVLVEVEGVAVEDGSWLRTKGDVQHINVAELEAVVKGLNLAIKWELTVVEVMSDSATVCGWLRSVINDSHRPRTSGLSEMVIKRRLCILGELMSEYGMSVTVTNVPSATNKADPLTRVDRRWLSHAAAGAAGSVREATSGEDGVHRPTVQDVKDIHEQHHFGLDRTLHFVRQRFGESVRESDVRDVVQSCIQCRSIDPAPVRWDTGSLEVDQVWSRLAADIVHVGGATYLSLIDCGPGRYAIWRRLDSERASAVLAALVDIFRERGAPRELLTDNGPCFRSVELVPTLSHWGVVHMFSCAYRPTGNGIVERHHRTIKRMCARTGKPPAEMLLWYNNSPNDRDVVPSESVLSYSCRYPGYVDADNPASDAPVNRFKVGDEVFVRPHDARCTTTWPRKVVSGIVSSTSVEVDGTPRHVRDLRLAARCLDRVEIRSQGVAQERPVEQCGSGFDVELALGVTDNVPDVRCSSSTGESASLIVESAGSSADMALHSVAADSERDGPGSVATDGEGGVADGGATAATDGGGGVSVGVATDGEGSVPGARARKPPAWMSDYVV